MLQTDALSSSTSIASKSSEQTKRAVKAGAVNVYIKLMESSNPDVCEQAVRALETITRKNPIHRNHVLRRGIIAPLSTLLEQNEPVSASFWKYN